MIAILSPCRRGKAFALLPPQFGIDDPHQAEIPLNRTSFYPSAFLHSDTY